MSSTLLVKNLIWQCSILLQDASPQFTRWTEEELVRWLNEGRRVLTKFMPMVSSRMDVVKLKAGTRQYFESIAGTDIIPCDGSTASDIRTLQVIDIIRNMGANGTTPGRPIRIVDRQDLDSLDPDWHTRVSPRIQNFTVDPVNPTYAYVYPGVTGTMWVEMSVCEDLPDLPFPASPGYGHDLTSATTLGIDDRYADDLLNYICARAHLKDSKYSDSGKAAGFVSLFTASLNAQVKAATGVNPNLQRLPFAGDPIGVAK